MSKENRLKVYAKLIRHLLGVAAALWELITGEQAPAAKDVLTLEISK